MTSTKLGYGIDDGNNNPPLRQGTYSSRYRCVQVTKVDDGGGSTMERMIECMRKRSPQQTNFPHIFACTLDDTWLSTSDSFTFPYKLRIK
jgi:hypothetical protein